MGMILRLFFLLLFAGSAALAQESTAPQSELSMVQGRYVIDVRTRPEWDKDHIEGATLIPPEQIARLVPQAIPDKSAPISLYCHSGGRSGAAMKMLRSMGYTDVKNLGGIKRARRELAEGR